jgi:hypothetical protein
VLERASTNASHAAQAGTVIAGKGHPSTQVREDHDVRNGPVAHVRTLGWAPGCACGVPPVPATVLDPFLGAGTVARVALDLGRAWRGCELSTAYVPLITDRTRQLGLHLGG